MMAVQINTELKKIIEDPASIKVIASVDLDGRPHVVAKGSISLTDAGQIQYLEFFENSKTNKNLLASLWYDKTIAINVISSDKRSFQIKGRAVRSIIAGRGFEEYYIKAQARDPENDLSSIYLIDIDEVIEQTYRTRRKEERERNPLYIHLDRLVKKVEGT
jgi:predicted pyridoxine 5'-phosphate oxidase superfamily flavin-nucleotide-binding protein